ncbi:TPA: hypothetical protein PXM28_000714 [Yersinia enterocolitica]|nr:hypothetical protein [Yersinia enterocolitica]
MINSITQSFSICTHDHISPLENNISKVDEGKSEKGKPIQFQQENINNSDELFFILSQHNHKFPLSKSVPIHPGEHDFYCESKNEINFRSKIGTERTIKELITDQIKKPVLEIAVNKLIEELMDNNKLKFSPMNPDVSTINFDFDNNNNLIMYQKLQYKEYARYTTDEANAERHVVCEGDDPYVTVDYYVKFSPAGNIINDRNNLKIQFNGCSDDLKTVFDKRSLWAKICDYFREAFNFHPNISDMKFMAPDLDNKKVCKPGRANILMELSSMDEKNRMNEMKELALIKQLTKHINDQPTNNIPRLQTENEENDPILPKEETIIDSSILNQAGDTEINDLDGKITYLIS